MKIKFILGIVCLSLATILNAQTKVPAAAESAFKQKFPSATNVKWDKENKNEYEAAFILDGKKGSANFSSTGEWLETEVGVALTTVPAEVLAAVKNAYPASTVKEVFSIETKAGKHYYEVEYTIGKKTNEVKVTAEGAIFK